LYKTENVKFNRQGLTLPVELFQVDDEYYVFDINKVIFLEVKQIVFKVLSTLKKKKNNEIDDIVAYLPEYSAQEIQDALDEIESFQSEGYFKPMEFQRDNPYSMPDIKDSLSHKLKGMFLNVTSKCNLSCSYCLLSGDYINHTGLNQQEMAWDTARKAIDFFVSRAKKDGCFRVDFFGGEPLLSFPLIKRIVSSIKEMFNQRNQELMIAITSNGTIMTEEIVDFLYDNDVLLQFSIDGTKELHDTNRKFKGTDVGSFDTIVKNLQLISDRNNDFFLNNIRLKAVITTESIEISDTDFLNLPLIKVLIDKNRFTMVNKYPHYDLKKDQDYFARIHRLGEFLLQKKDVSNIKELLDGLIYKSKNLYFVTFNYFFDIQVVNYLHFDIEKPVPYSKDCMIGIDAAVNTDGRISICYNSDTFIIGNVIEDTWYWDKIAAYHKIRYSLDNCQTCFVQRFCNLCYEKLNDREESLDIKVQNFCQFTHHFFRTIFNYMLKILQRNPKLWNELQAMAEERKDILMRKKSEKPGGRKAKKSDI
jgi:uncharacterized protein